MAVPSNHRRKIDGSMVRLMQLLFTPLGRHEARFGRRVVLILIALLTCPAAQAEEPTPAASKLVRASFQYMANAYLCRDALGGLAAYHAAITIAQGNLMLVGVSQADAVLMVAKMKERFENDPRAKDPGLDAGACLDTVNDSLFAVNVAKAEYVKAGG